MVYIYFITQMHRVVVELEGRSLKELLNVKYEVEKPSNVMEVLCCAKVRVMLAVIQTKTD